MNPSPVDCPGIAAALALLHKASAALDRPVLVGIGGPGGSGKSSFALALSRHLDDVQLVPLDDYRKPRHERPPRIYGSHPAGNRLDLLKTHLDDARNGRPFERPVYSHERGASTETELVPPARFIIAEGEIAAHRYLRPLFDLRILITADWSLQWQARMGRDRSERACSLPKALSVFVISNLRDYPRFAAGSHRDAELILRRSRCGRWLSHG